MNSHLLVGKMRHKRLKPRRYDFEHDVFYLAIDLAELDEVVSRVRLLSYNRPNVCTLRDEDHFAGGPLAAEAAAAAGIGRDPAPGELLAITYPRVLGYVFNPVSFYLHHEGGALRSMVAEVHNTHGERHVYSLQPRGSRGTPWRAAADKSFYVSPFISMDADYRFAVRETADSLFIGIAERDHGQHAFYADIRLERRPLNDRELSRALARMPLVPLKTSLLIHWHAFRLWRRGVPFHPHREAGR
jgi:DUF1365 family protein